MANMPNIINVKAESDAGTEMAIQIANITDMLHRSTSSE